MATKKKAKEPEVETPDEPAEEKPVDLDKQLREMAEAQRQSQEAYEDSGPPEPTI